MGELPECIRTPAVYFTPRSTRLHDVANRIPDINAENSGGKGAGGAGCNAYEGLNPVDLRKNLSLFFLLVISAIVEEDLIFLVARDSTAVGQKYKENRRNSG